MGRYLDMLEEHMRRPQEGELVVWVGNLPISLEATKRLVEIAAHDVPGSCFTYSGDEL